ncbi:hypothetical protein EJB05_50740 [Eragrostis curvula]|uniref:Uncharacterized protein n=1 Tax=Eragrostis curvula TaxID=38414 RepID=A0A5J9SXH1_9POAL|nr:hypothetical protein EJB05_50740 [Eragrostis curvula]
MAGPRPSFLGCWHPRRGGTAEHDAAYIKSALRFPGNAGIPPLPEIEKPREERMRLGRRAGRQEQRRARVGAAERKEERKRRKSRTAPRPCLPPPFPLPTPPHPLRSTGGPIHLRGSTSPSPEPAYVGASNDVAHVQCGCVLLKKPEQF